MAVDLTDQERDREAAFKESLPTVNNLQQRAWRIAEEHGFHDVGQSLGDKLMLIVSEAAEALEAFRDGHAPNEEWWENDGKKPCGVPSEIADIVIRCLDFAEEYDFDLEGITLAKMAYNDGRPYLHGRTF